MFPFQEILETIIYRLTLLNYKYVPVGLCLLETYKFEYIIF